MNTNTTIAFADYVFQSDDTVKTTSLNVAKAFDKQHKNVLQKIDELLTQVPDFFGKLNFQPLEIERINNLGKIVKDRAYELTKDGFMLLVMGFTGKKAMQTKIAFIEAFNWMAAQLGLNKGKPTTPDERTGLRQAVTMLTTKLKISHSDAYVLVHQRFNVSHIDEIPREQLGEAVEYVQRMALEGELLPRQESQYTDDKAREQRVNGIYLLDSGLEQYKEQSGQLRQAWTMAADMVTMAERIMALLGTATHNGARVYTALSEAQFKLCHDSEERREGREKAAEWLASR